MSAATSAAFAPKIVGFRAACPVRYAGGVTARHPADGGGASGNGASGIGASAFARRLRRAVAGDVRFDSFSRARYATDASIYQVAPLGIVAPKSADDIAAALALAREEGIPVLPRGGGTSQCGQTVGRALVVDTSKYLDAILAVDPERRRAAVEPGLTLDRLNAALAKHGLFFPVDVSTGSRATLGGMAGNNSCGARSIRYGNMVHNVHAIEALLASGAAHRFAPVPGGLDGLDAPPDHLALVRDLRALAAREAGEIAARFPKLLRRVGGYNLDTLSPHGHNMASLLVGSEGTLAFFTALELDLQPLPRHRALGVCRFDSLHAAMRAAKPVVALDPTAVELADRTLLELAHAAPAFRATVERFAAGPPAAVLLVEFAGDEREPAERALAGLEALMADLGHPGAVARVAPGADQAAVWEMRKAGLNIVMSMKGDAKPVSFVEDCAVALDDLPDYTARMSDLFARHGAKATWYAHASVGCLHVRPVLNMKDPAAAGTMRAIAEESFAMVRDYRGAHSGEHGDGLVRSEFHETVFGSRLARAFEAVKDRFDPGGVLNPGKIARPPRMDDRALFRYPPGYAPDPASGGAPALDWSAWGPGGLLSAVEMCNGNGACRKAAGGVMCPSYRATRDEAHVTRGRANTLRHALTGQLGPGALESDAMAESMALCIGCKACRRECPTGVDMARMKIEVLRRRAAARGFSWRDRAVGWLPRAAPWLSRAAGLSALRDRSRLARRAGEAWFGLSAARALPRWAPDPCLETPEPAGSGPEAVLFVDTFTTWFEPEIARAARKLLRAAGRRVRVARAAPRGRWRERPLCCGRTFLAVGAVDEARAEAERALAVLAPHAEAGRPIVGLEPSCLHTLADEWPVLAPGPAAEAVARAAVPLETFLVREGLPGEDAFGRGGGERRVLVHGHCHQKAFGVAGDVAAALARVPGLDVAPIESTCCGMAGAFGYQAETQAVSRAIAGLDLLPALAAAPADAAIVADGFSCRRQIADLAGRPARHAALLLAEALA